MEAAAVMDFVRDAEIRVATLLQVAERNRPSQDVESTGTLRLLRRWRR
jgi:hypothetical protein